jgi:hypothetical protein
MCGHRLQRERDHLDTPQEGERLRRRPMRLGLLRVAGLVLSVVALSSSGCPASDDAENAADTCPAGSEACACYGNGTCDGRLDCRSDVCVDLGQDTGGEAGPAAGAPSSGAGGDGTAGQSSSSPVEAGAGGGSESGSGGAAGSISAGGTAGTEPPPALCSDAGGACDASVFCCAGSVCIGEAPSTGVCAATCTDNAECFSGCCVPLASGSGSACGPPGLCATPPGPCDDFFTCMVENPFQGSFPDSPACNLADSNATTADFCAGRCPSEGCASCISSSAGCAQWRDAQADCSTYLAAMGQFGSGTAEALRVALATYCP